MENEDKVDNQEGADKKSGGKDIVDNDALVEDERQSGDSGELSDSEDDDDDQQSKEIRRDALRDESIRRFNNGWDDEL